MDGVEGVCEADDSAEALRLARIALGVDHVQHPEAVEITEDEYLRALDGQSEATSEAAVVNGTWKDD